MDEFEVCIAGAGVVGLAIARQLVCFSRPGASVLLLDQASGFGQQVSSRNSEVIHAGIYYPADSLKTALCVQGKEALYHYCQKREIAHRRLGKLIVAQDGELERLAALQEQAGANGVEDLVWLEQAQLRQLEPAVSGAAALLSPSTGIIDSHAYMQSLLQDAQLGGALFVPQTLISRAEYRGDSIRIDTRHCDQGEHYSFRCRALINCAGLGAQNLAESIEGLADREDAPAPPIPRLHLCKGDYFTYSGINPFRHLIYPLPDRQTRGLGIHATLDLGNQLRFGPDAEYVDAENYAVDAGKAEGFAAAIARYFPDIEADRLQPGYAGIRPKLAGPDDPPADFVVQCRPQATAGNLIQLFGIESPGLTASLALAEHVAARLSY